AVEAAKKILSTCSCVNVANSFCANLISSNLILNVSTLLTISGKVKKQASKIKDKAEVKIPSKFKIIK
ncbi:hypothetical protein, partial [Clostridioides difficile]|uniref:hypothetical protein n=1 Tax=Clostridioides difficile TaxID=1496 RepID=UPI003F8D1FE9